MLVALLVWRIPASTHDPGSSSRISGTLRKRPVAVPAVACGRVGVFADSCWDASIYATGTVHCPSRQGPFRHTCCFGLASVVWMTHLVLTNTTWLFASSQQQPHVAFEARGWLCQSDAPTAHVPGASQALRARVCLARLLSYGRAWLLFGGQHQCILRPALFRASSAGDSRPRKATPLLL